jgi:hypothetical protein
VSPEEWKRYWQLLGAVLVATALTFWLGMR